MMFHYLINFECANCGHEAVIKIPKGTTIKEFLADESGKCSYCKCNEFKSFKKLKDGVEKRFMITNNDLKGGLKDNGNV